MKFLLTFFFIGFFLITASYAQTSSLISDEALELQATKETRYMENIIKFNEWEYIVIKDLNSKRIVEVLEAKHNYSNDPAKLAEIIRKLEKDYDNEISKRLTFKQRRAYAIFKEDNKNKELLFSLK